jgi:DNA-binding transcriptional MerR regulator
MDKSPDAFRTISEAADDLDLPQHVLRFWETRFPQIKPLKRAGGRRYYRPDDVELLRVIKQLLYGEGYTIKGVQRLFKEQGARGVAALKPGAAASPKAELDFAGKPSAHGDVELRPHEHGEGSIEPRRTPIPRAAFSAADLQALHGALADIVEGERVLTLARAT